MRNCQMDFADGILIINNAKTRTYYALRRCGKEAYISIGRNSIRMEESYAEAAAAVTFTLQISCHIAWKLLFALTLTHSARTLVYALQTKQYSNDNCCLLDMTQHNSAELRRTEPSERNDAIVISSFRCSQNFLFLDIVCCVLLCKCECFFVSFVFAFHRIYAHVNSVWRVTQASDTVAHHHQQFHVRGPTRTKRKKILNARAFCLCWISWII